MNHKKSEQGQALIVIALAIVVLFGFAGLTIDGSRAFSDRRNAQNAADTAAMAAALARTRGTDYTAAATSRTTSNGYNNNGTTNIVAVTAVDSPSGACPATGKDITVAVTSYVPTTLARVFGWTQFTNIVSATGRACDVSGGAGGPAFPGQSVYTTKSGTCNSGANPALYNSGGDLQIWGGDVGSSSTDASCIKFNAGQTQLKLAETDHSVCSDLLSAATSGVSKGNISGQDGCGNLKMGQSFPSVPADLGITCSGNATKSGSTLSPGNYYKANFGNLDFPGGATSLDPGTYCVMDGNVNVTGSLSGSGVTLYVKQGSATFTNASTVNLTGPTSGAYKGLTVYLPPSNSNPVVFSGQSNMVFNGTFMAQSSACSFANTGVQLQKVAVQFVCSTWGMLGGQAEITYDPTVIYSPQSQVQATITMLK